MNFLAHIYLSNDNDLIKIGNFMADGIRGNDYLNYPQGVKKGIILHRKIDTFTDAHEVFRISKHRLHERYGHYSGVIVDILYDHFLAKNWSKYSEETLDKFVARFYKSLKDNYEVLTPRTKRILPLMIEQNWLLSYATIEGISKILYQMDSRTKFKSKMQFSPEELKIFYTEFENEFTLFFEELRIHVAQKLIELKIQYP
ncbi:acyl carrier protein phosphodiesterase [uncultured Flavobacterium sp.]|uniref:acyl carrier protein phosphodiesterase n=1 Tax=uncultured Flavobacterium sp. TaxID=165435 RepID=UPI0030CA36A6